MSVIKHLHQISTDNALPLVDKIAHLLKVGSETLGLDTGIVSRVNHDTYEVMYVLSSNDTISAGMNFELKETYCADTIKAGGIIAYHDVDAFPGASHPCYEKYTLSSYIAAPIYVNKQCYGTLNFSSDQAKVSEFSNIDYDYILLFADWIGSEIEKQQAFADMAKQQEVLAEQNTLLTQITALVGVGTWEYHVNSGQLRWCDTLKRMLHIHPARNITIEEVLALIKHEETKAQYQSKFEEIMRTGEDWNYELEVLTDAGETKWLESRAHPIFENGNCVKVVGATRDISERIFTLQTLQDKTEIAEKALAARSDFLANMSHEIRTPIHGVQGMLETLEASTLSSQQKGYVNVAMKSAEALLGIVNDVLDFSKIDSGQMTFEESPVNIEEVIQHQLPMFERLANKKGLEFTADTKPLSGHLFMADSLRLNQVLINLINNAIKFTLEGNVKVTTRCTKYGPDRYRIKLIVTDTGIGISEAQQAVIFSPFLQAEESTQRRFGGTGLGLAIVHKIISHYGGSIDVSSELGAGTRFIVTLTLDCADGIAPKVNQYKAQARYTAAELKNTFKNAKVLVVEDNEINQIVIKEQLKEIGLNVEVAENGEVGVAKVTNAINAKVPYTLILMDCHMPVMDGITATKHIRRLDGEVPIIALTANAMPSEKDKCLQAGMNDFISKPVGISRLRDRLLYHLSPSTEMLDSTA
ncbi:MAG: hybrid sensor histidine kinase/response regulator [Alteromonas sp.]|nr:hybrid sensor histidine kinase/response regulator [Alteromonas sp.]